jgi:TRAP-type C4-dicarboxylate transport system permease small subunit
MKPRTKAILKFLLDILELYVPMIAFLTIFVCFMIQIISRYFFTPLMWPEELALLSFIWAALLGALYAKRHEALVSFTLIYDKVSDRGRAIMRVAGNALLVAAFVISFKPSLDFVIFQGYKKSSVLYIPMNLVSSAYLIFLADITIRYVIDIVRDIRFLATGKPASAAGAST